jgi:N6-L-threonylcarbamoyladenine synthase
MRNEGLDFSFSGLKTAVVQYVRKHPEAGVADIAASFQAAVVDVLVEKLQAAAFETGITTVVAGGGVAANSALRARLTDLGAYGADGAGGDVKVVLPGIDLCTDNAAMVGAVAAYRLAADGPTPLEAPVVPNLRLV